MDFFISDNYYLRLAMRVYLHETKGKSFSYRTVEEMLLEKDRFYGQVINVYLVIENKTSSFVFICHVIKTLHLNFRGFISFFLVTPFDSKRSANFFYFLSCSNEIINDFRFIHYGVFSKVLNHKCIFFKKKSFFEKLNADWLAEKKFRLTKKEFESIYDLLSGLSLHISAEKKKRSVKTIYAHRYAAIQKINIYIKSRGVKNNLDCRISN